MRKIFGKTRWIAAIAIAVIAPFLTASSAQARSCQSAAKVASDLWDEYGKAAKQVGCAGVTVGVTVASGGLNLPASVKMYEECLAKTNKADQMGQKMISAWNNMANNKWATIGPRRLELNKTHSGNIVGPGTRMFITESPMTSNVLDLSIEKKKFRGKTDVTVCTYLPDGTEDTVWSFTIARGPGNIGKTWNKEISDVGGRIVSVFLNGRSAVKQMKYQVRAEPKDRLRPGEPSQQARGADVPHVVIAGPPSHRGGHPGVVRVRNVGDDGFDLRFQEWDYRERDHGDTNHKYERIPYLVLEPGRHQMPDGSVWEVGAFRLDGTKDWTSQSFNSSFEERPKLFLTVQTYNGSQAVNVRTRNVDQNGFDAALFEEEALNDGHLEEVVGYLAIQGPRVDGAIPGIDVKSNSGVALVDGFRVPYELKTVRVDDNGTDVGGVRLFIHEEKSDDKETGHVKETVDVLNIGGKVLAQDVSTDGGDSSALRQEGGDPGTGIIKTGRATADDGWRTFPAPPN